MYRATDFTSDIAYRFLESSAELFIALNRDLQIVSLNRLAMEISGQDQAWLEGRDFFSTYLQEGRWGKIRKQFTHYFEYEDKLPPAFDAEIGAGPVGRRVISWTPMHFVDPYTGEKLLLLSGKDITARTERYKEAIIDAIADVVMLNDELGNIEYISKSVSKVLGYLPEELMGRNVMEFIHPADRARLQKAHKKILNSPDAIVSSIHRVQHKNGGYRWVEGEGRIFKKEEGEMTVLSNFRDITQRKSLEQDKERFEILLNASTDMVTIMSEEGEILYMNHEARKRLGLKEKSGIEKQNAFNFFRLPEQTLLRKEYIPTAIKEGFWRGDLESVSTKGEALSVSMLLIAVKNRKGQVEFMATICRDISERKEIEQKLGESRERYRMLVETMHEGVIYVDRSSKVRFVNDRFCELTGFARNELLDSNFLPLLNGDLGQNFLSTMDSGKENSPVLDAYETEFVNRKGDTIWVSITGVAVRDENGAIIGSLATMADITAKKEAEMQLHSIHKELQGFVFKSSHDLKGPLASIIGLTDIAKMDVTDPMGVKYIDMIRQSAQRLDNSLADFLETLKIRGAKPQPEPINFKTTVQDILESLQHSPDFAHIFIKLDINVEKPFRTDPKIVYSVLQNLIDNAMKYRNPKAQPSWLSLSILDEGAGIRLVAQDNGLGMSQEIQERVFDMFFRAHLESKGTGLGLYIVKSAVEKLGGNIFLESVEGVGSSFSVYLPDLG